VARPVHSDDAAQHAGVADAHEAQQRPRLKAAQRRLQVVEGDRRVAGADGVLGAEDDRAQAGVLRAVADGDEVGARGRHVERRAELQGPHHPSSSLMSAAAA
jgi:hypothetical protein